MSEFQFVKMGAAYWIIPPRDRDPHICAVFASAKGALFYGTTFPEAMQIAHYRSMSFRARPRYLVRIRCKPQELPCAS